MHTDTQMRVRIARTYRLYDVCVRVEMRRQQGTWIDCVCVCMRLAFNK